MHQVPTTTPALHRRLLRQYCRCATQLTAEHQCTPRDPIHACSAGASERRTLIWPRNATLRRSDFEGILQMRPVQHAIWTAHMLLRLCGSTKSGLVTLSVTYYCRRQSQLAPPQLGTAIMHRRLHLSGKPVNPSGPRLFALLLHSTGSRLTRQHLAAGTGAAWHQSGGHFSTPRCRCGEW
jgi:hypothetical protein